MNKLQRVTIKSMTADTVTVAGYGVIFGGMDLEGETFGPDTDYMLDLVPQKPVLYDHGMNHAVSKSIIGFVGKADPDDVGLWVEAELSRHNEYMAAILDLVEKGALGWSSGSVGQLTLREGKSIKRWPIVELSLTPTPAEPRTLGVEQLKALAAALPALKELSTAATVADDIAELPEVELETGEPEDARPASAPVADAEGSEATDAPEMAHDGGQDDDGPDAADPETDLGEETEMDTFYAVIGDFIDTISERIGRIL